MHVEIKWENECYRKERVRQKNTQGEIGQDDGKCRVSKSYGVSLLGVKSERDDSENDSRGAEYRACRDIKLLYSDDERPAESCRKRGNERIDWIRSGSSERDFGDLSVSNQMDGIVAGVVSTEKGWGLSSGMLSADDLVTPSPS